MNVLLKYRKSQKLSQKQLAELIGISQSVLCEYENGIKIPRPKTALKIERATKISRYDLIFPVTDEQGNNPEPTQ